MKSLISITKSYSSSRFKISIVFIIICFFCVFWDYSRQLVWFHSTINYISTPIQYLITVSSKGIGNISSTILYIGKLRSENTNLKNEISILKSQETQLKEIKEQNENLLKQLNSGYTIPEVNQIYSRIFLNTITEKGRIIKVDVGFNDGVKEGNVAIIGGVLIGKVKEVNANDAIIIPLDNLNNEFIVYEMKTKSNGILTSSKDGLFVNDLLQSSDINPNDSIMYWNEELSLPLLVGTVDKVITNDASPTKTAKVIPAIEYGNLSYLYILNKK